VPGNGADGTSERETEDVLAEVEQLIGLLTAHTDPAVGVTATALLDRKRTVRVGALVGVFDVCPLYGA